jgi:hypothetical protein
LGSICSGLAVAVGVTTQARKGREKEKKERKSSKDI